MAAVESSGPCSLGEECAEYKNLAFLLVSLGITIILVGALFYYVKQRFEVLEVSHKEQIGVMRNFITSIGEQFQRMSMSNDSPLHIQEQKQMQPLQMQQRNEDRLSISDSSDDDDGRDDDDSEYDDDSDSSDTDIMDAYRIRGGSGGGDIVFCNDDDEPSNPRVNELSDIKIIELSDELSHDYVGGGGDPGDAGDHDDVDESDDSDSSDSSDSSDASDASDDANNGSTDSKRMIVIKTDLIGVAPPKNNGPKEELENASVAHSRDRNMLIDLDLDLDLDTNASTSTVDATTTSNTSNSNSIGYAQMSIKQLRQSVKRLNEHKHLDTSKLKRDQLLAILG